MSYGLLRNHYPFRIILKREWRGETDLGCQTEAHARGSIIELIKLGVPVLGVIVRT